jgi:DNA-binding transcriptional regulator GbsR (MarR family)
MTDAPFVTLAHAKDRKNIFYAMHEDVYQVFREIGTGALYAQVFLFYNPLDHPDEIVKRLARQLERYEIVGDPNV